MPAILHIAEVVGAILAATLIGAAIVVLLVIRRRTKTGSAPTSALDAREIEMINGSSNPSTQGATRRGGADMPLPNAISQLINARLEETRAMEDKEETLARWSGMADVFLTTGGYIVGGVLATSFAEHELPSFLVGGLGLIVLVSSMAQQSFHPERSKIKAARKAARLRKLVRETEDTLLIAESSPSGKARVEIIQRLSRELAEIESAEEDVFPVDSFPRRDSRGRN